MGLRTTRLGPTYMWHRMEPTHESSCWPTTTRNDVPITPHTQSATKKISIYNSTTVSSSWYVSIFCWWHWRTLHLMRAPYFVDDTYGHCIWSKSTIWSLDFRISSSQSPHTFCRANQHVVGWLGRQWFLEPTKVKVPVLAFYLVLISVFSGDVRSVGGDVPLDYEEPMVTSSNVKIIYTGPLSRRCS